MKFVKCMNFTQEQLDAISRALYNDYSPKYGSDHQYLIGAYLRDGAYFVEVKVDNQIKETFHLVISNYALGLSEQLLQIINKKAELMFREELFYGVKDEGTLSAIISSIMGSFAGQQFYPGIVKKATMYWYKIATSQVFHNGNKRTALLSALYMLNYNGFSLRRVDGNELYRISVQVAKKELSAEQLEDFILRNLTLNYFDSEQAANENRWAIDMNIRVDNPNA
ncbi:type II toxin-antitoxin system death-on-curing family toxin [Lacticaseibacillus absianus]|uniref:type II toxin-antitoxin system death-on-curing family toxin n=1 Tax=Lacticaseibacillus absianus TaxID=2729623 RepID=UPI0015CC8717|nr:type II toxin-antitoxin system death-on-curing family toxin [Lacticaseibacillus absianus]